MNLARVALPLALVLVLALPQVHAAVPPLRVQDAQAGVLQPGETTLLFSTNFPLVMFHVFYTAPDSVGPAEGTLVAKTCGHRAVAKPAMPAGHEEVWTATTLCSSSLWLVAGDAPLAYTAVVAMA